MRSIYADPEKVIIWLGDDDDDKVIDRAVFLLNTLYSAADLRASFAASIVAADTRWVRKWLVRLRDSSDDQQVRDLTGLCSVARVNSFVVALLKFWRKYKGSRKLNPAFMDQFHEMHGDDFVTEIVGGVLPDMNALSLLFSKSWWSRCWIVQERVVAKEAEILWGSRRVTWDCINFVRQSLSYSVIKAMGEWLPTKLIKSIFETPWAVSLLQLQEKLAVCTEMEDLIARWKAQELTMRDLLAVSQTRGATNPKDKVYAMLGLIGAAHGIVPRYVSSTSIADVFVEATKRVIELDRCLDIIADATQPYRRQDLELPSWVPDLTAQRDSSNTEDRGPGSADASGTRSGMISYCRNPVIFGFLPDGQERPDRILHCIGIHIDTVATPSTICDISEVVRGDKAAAERYKRCLEALDIDSKLPDDPASEPIFDRVLHSLRLDTTIDRSDALRYIKQAQKDDNMGTPGYSCFFVTPGNVPGIIQVPAKHDDVLYVLCGACVPFVLHPIPGPTSYHYTLVGTCYLHGYMGGMAPLEAVKGKLKLYNIWIY